MGWFASPYGRGNDGQANRVAAHSVITANAWIHYASARTAPLHHPREHGDPLCPGLPVAGQIAGMTGVTNR